jgi:hypothetical protein
MSRKLTLLVLLLVLSLTVFTQTKSKKTVKKPVKKPAVVKTAPATATTSPVEPDPAKKNERPSDTPASTQTDTKKTSRPAESKAAAKPSYPFFYEFTQPAFFISRITIEHDDNGKGTVTFLKRDYNEAYTDPVQLSPATMQKLKTWWDNLHFLDSTENYQADKDFTHLGTIRLRLKRDKRERAVTFNWTDNKDAKSLMDEYRNLGQQYVWIFDITLARENQPLEAPKLMENFDNMVRRNEISDPQQMLPLLKDLSEDERIPLLARNHALKIIKQIEKDKK